MNISRLAVLPESSTGALHRLNAGLSAGSLSRNRVRYALVIAIGAGLILASTLIYPANVGGANWWLAAVALGVLLAGVRAHATLSATVRTARREARVLGQRLSAEASSSRVLAGIKLLNTAGARTVAGGEPAGADAQLAVAARMSTGYAAAIVFTLRDAHGVFVPSDWSYDGDFFQSGDEFEPVDGGTPGARAARQGAALVMSLTDEASAGLPGWAEQAGFLQGIVTPITRGFDTVGVVYVFNKSADPPTLSEMEQLELIVSFVSVITGATGKATNGRISVDTGAGERARPFRTADSRSDRRHSKTTGISMPGFSLNPDLERMELDGVALSLSPTEFLLVHTLASSPGKPVSPVDLVNACWSANARPADNALDVAIFRLRRKLSKTSSGNGLIKTVRGSGYMFVPPAPRVENPVFSAAD